MCWVYREFCSACVCDTRTITRSCRIRKCAFHLYSPGVVRRSHAAARQVRALARLRCCRCCISAAAATAAAGGAGVYKQFDN